MYLLLLLLLLCLLSAPSAAGTQVPELGNFFQQQALAVPANSSDPYLKQWTKLSTNPFIAQVS
jgi:hypothetical protein